MEERQKYDVYALVNELIKYIVCHLSKYQQSSTKNKKIKVNINEIFGSIDTTADFF